MNGIEYDICYTQQRIYEDMAVDIICNDFRLEKNRVSA